MISSAIFLNNGNDVVHLKKFLVKTDPEKGMGEREYGKAKGWLLHRIPIDWNR